MQERASEGTAEEWMEYSEYVASVAAQVNQEEWEVTQLEGDIDQFDLAANSDED